jgi:hypothetical protein
MCVRGKSLRRSRRGGEGREEEETKAGIHRCEDGNVGSRVRRPSWGVDGIAERGVRCCPWGVHRNAKSRWRRCPWESTAQGIPSASLFVLVPVRLTLEEGGVATVSDRSWRGGAGERVRTFVDHPGGVCYKTTTTTTRKRRAGSSTSSQMRATIRTSAKRRDRKSRPLTMDGIPTAGRGTIFIGWDCFMCEA